MPYIGAPLKSTSFVLDQFTATAGQTAFTLTQSPATAQSIMVGIDGVFQEPGTAYTISGTTLTMTSGVPLNARVYVIHLGVRSTISVPAAGSVVGASLSLSQITASLGADVLLNNTANYFDGPSIAQGTTGTWWVSGQVVIVDSTAAASMQIKLWDGTTVIDSANVLCPAANFQVVVSLSGFKASPAGNLRISVKDGSTTAGTILFNASGNSKDSTISAFRIG